MQPTCKLHCRPTSSTASINTAATTHLQQLRLQSDKPTITGHISGTHLQQLRLQRRRRKAAQATHPCPRCSCHRERAAERHHISRVHGFGGGPRQQAHQQALNRVGLAAAGADGNGAGEC